MKLIRNLTGKLVAGGVALCVLTWASELSAQSGNQGNATVTAVRGQARYSTDNRTWRPVKVGLRLKAGTVIQTAGGNSYVDLVLGDRESSARPPVVGVVFNPNASGGGAAESQDSNVIRLNADTILAIDKVTAEETGADVVSETQLDLRAGRIMGNVKKLSAASRYEVKFPTGVAGVRGTIYTIDKNGVTEVLVGSVVVSYLKDGAVVTQVVMGGSQFDPATGLVTPIPDFRQKELVKEFKSMNHGNPNVPPTSYTVDGTIYYVSPTTGHNGNAGGNGPPPERPGTVAQ